MSYVFPSQKPDPVFLKIAEYIAGPSLTSKEAYATARLCLADALGCAVLALQFPECRKLLGPLTPGMRIPNGCLIPGTAYILDPVSGAFNIGTLIRWLDYNDTWLAAEWGHPSDNLGSILAVSDYLSRNNISAGKKPLRVKQVLTAMIKAYEIQGCLALENSLNRVGLDHVLLVKVASAGIVAHLLGARPDQIVDTLSQAFIDNGPLRTYRHFPNTGSRKSWAAGDATSRGTWLAMMVLRGEMGYPTALTAREWGFNDVVLDGNPILLRRPLGSYVMENILFKISFPAEFHGQTAVEAALQLHRFINGRLDKIEKIVLETQESAVRIISKTGPLRNPADRDHCLQYMAAVGLLYGELTAEHYQDVVAQDPRIDALRKKMVVRQNKQFSRDYLDPSKRSIANGVHIFFRDGSAPQHCVIHYPLGHRRRRAEALPHLFKKFESNLASCFSTRRVRILVRLFEDQERLESLPVNELMDCFRRFHKTSRTGYLK